MSGIFAGDNTPSLARIAMIDLKNESPISLSQAARMLPPGRRGRPVTLSCLLRWVIDGVKTPAGPVRLEAIRLGGRWLTSIPALERFAARQTPTLGGSGQTPRTPGQRSRESARAARDVEKVGL
jgi:hypothetical protein